MSPQKVIPSFVRGGHSVRYWKSMKRMQLKRARAALSDLRYGCVWFPDGSYVHVDAALKALAALSGKLAVKNWGR